MSIPTPSLPFWDNLQVLEFFWNKYKFSWVGSGTIRWEQKKSNTPNKFWKTLSFIFQCYFVRFFVHMSIIIFFLPYIGSWQSKVKTSLTQRKKISLTTPHNSCLLETYLLTAIFLYIWHAQFSSVPTLVDIIFKDC